MNTLKRVGSILIVASCCLIPRVWAAPNPECGDRVSLAELVANPDKYHGKTISVVAHITIDFENMTACPSENNTQMESCLWINIDDGTYKTEQDYPRYEAMLQNWKRFNRQTVSIHATFDKGEKGHFSMWPSGLRNVTEVSGRKDGWSFATDSAAQYNCLTGE